MSMPSTEEIIKRIIKYLIQGLVIAVVATIAPQKSLKMDEIIILALAAAATFGFLDMMIPSMGDAARQGAGLGIGFQLVKFPF
jgi:hypothetical protein